MNSLIEVAELAGLIASDRPPIVADVRWNLGGPPALPEFEAGHLPGAQWIDLETELTGEPGPEGRHPLPGVQVFQTAMRRIGVSADSTVVVCDAGNALPASRLWWLLTDAGLADVRVLNGGVAAWADAGLPLWTGPAATVQPGSFVARPGHRDQVGADEVLEMVRSGARPIVDVRAPERYAGATEPIDPVAGHIPGARNFPSMINLGVDGRFLSADMLRERYAALPDDPVIYCGSGITAAHTLLALERAGRSGSIYPGSWSGWITDPSRPVATGDQP